MIVCVPCNTAPGSLSSATNNRKLWLENVLYLLDLLEESYWLALENTHTHTLTLVQV